MKSSFSCRKRVPHWIAKAFFGKVDWRHQGSPRNCDQAIPGADNRLNMAMGHTTVTASKYRVVEPRGMMTSHEGIKAKFAALLLALAMAIGLARTDAHAAPPTTEAQAEMGYAGAPATTSAAIPLPPLPPPHPRRASATRRAAYKAMLTSWQTQHPHEVTAQASTAREQHRPSAPAPSQPSPSEGNLPPTNTPVTNDTPADTWTTQEIAEAEQQCESLLDGVAMEADRLEPLRIGDCGTPRPLRLRRIGSGTGVTLKPAATTNCAMTARLYQWLETVAQPAAKRAFGSTIVKLHNASSYMCRHRYNDPAKKISEHAFANALDISAFELADGRTIDVKRYWGLVVEGQQAARAAQQANATSNTTNTATKQTDKPSGLGARSFTKGIIEAKADEKPDPGEQALSETAELAFLKEVHNGACGTFSTVLGPQANQAHHDHFHFDLKQRRGAAYCE